MILLLSDKMNDSLFTHVFLNGFRGSRSSKFQKKHDFSVIVCVLWKSFHIFVGNYVEFRTKAHISLVSAIINIAL